MLCKVTDIMDSFASLSSYKQSQRIITSKKLTVLTNYWEGRISVISGWSSVSISSSHSSLFRPVPIRYTAYIKVQYFSVLSSSLPHEFVPTYATQNLCPHRCSHNNLKQSRTSPSNKLWCWVMKLSEWKTIMIRLLPPIQHNTERMKKLVTGEKRGRLTNYIRKTGGGWYF